MGRVTGTLAVGRLEAQHSEIGQPFQVLQPRAIDPSAAIFEV